MQLTDIDTALANNGHKSSCEKQAREATSCRWLLVNFSTSSAHVCLTYYTVFGEHVCRLQVYYIQFSFNKSTRCSSIHCLMPTVRAPISRRLLLLHCVTEASQSAVATFTQGRQLRCQQWPRPMLERTWRAKHLTEAAAELLVNQSSRRPFNAFTVKLTSRTHDERPLLWEKFYQKSWGGFWEQIILLFSSC